MPMPASNPIESVSRQALLALQTWVRDIHSFVELCPPSCRRKGDLKHRLVNDLTGLSIGVKDIIDVKGIPTRNGSDACQHVLPAEADADVVASLRAAGAHIFGKTTTTEFAFTDPTTCRNPHDLTRTPGGSSSGSGAAVAAGVVDMALGTQTAGSLCRPAAYCGVVGFKPTYALLSVAGVTPLSKSFDTVGIIARSVDIAQRCFLAMTDCTAQESTNEPVMASTLLPTQTVATAETMDAFREAAHALRQAGGSLRDVTVNLKIDDIVSAHRTVMTSQAVQAHRSLVHPDRISLLRPKFRAGLEAGTRVSATELEAAHGLLSSARSDFWSQLAGIDIILTLPVPEAAPLMDGTTGFQDWLTPWTVFGGPLICLPWGLDNLSRPQSIMLSAPPGGDLPLLAMAKHLEHRAPVLPHPKAPPDQEAVRE